jgi:hypothetical protein
MRTLDGYGGMVLPCGLRFQTLALAGNGAKRVGCDAGTGATSKYSPEDASLMYLQVRKAKTTYYWAFYLYGPEKMALPCMALFLNLPLWPQTFIHSMAFRPVLPLNGVKSRVERPFCPWHKKITEFCLFLLTLKSIQGNTLARPLDSPWFGLRKSEVLTWGQKFLFPHKTKTPTWKSEVLVGGQKFWSSHNGQFWLSTICCIFGVILSK